MRTLLLLGLALGCLVALAACSTPHRLEYDVLDGLGDGRSMDYAVWAPLDLDPDEALPLMVFLHGNGDDEESFDEAGVGGFLDAALAAGRIPRVVIVVPDGDRGFWENWYDGSHRYRDWVVEGVMSEVRSRYHTLPCPEGCHVAGTSMGGHGALRFAFFHPDRFGTVTALSGLILSADDVEDFASSWIGRWLIPFERIWGPVLIERERIESEDLFRQWQEQADLSGMRLMLGWAEQDRDMIRASNRRFHQHLLEHGIEHEFLLFPGGHAWTAWTPVLDQVLRFAIWGAADASGPRRDRREGRQASRPGHP